MMSLEVQMSAADATKIRRQAVELVSRVSSHEVFYFSIVEHEGVPHYASCISTSAYRIMEDYEGTPMLGGSVTHETEVRSWTAENPSKTAFNRFGTFAEEYRDISSMFGTEAYQAAYAPFEITDQARALMYDGQEFLGFIAATRQGGETFDASTLERLRAETEEVHRLLVLARNAESDENTGALHLIADEFGRLLYADERVRCWLTTRRAELLRAALARDRSFTIDSLVARVGWLDDGHRKIRHIALSPVEPLRASRWYDLSKTQRSIVQLALEGLSNREIARLQGIAESTVKYHLNEAARTLDVTGRAGLRRALFGGPNGVEEAHQA